MLARLGAAIARSAGATVAVAEVDDRRCGGAAGGRMAGSKLLDHMKCSAPATDRVADRRRPRGSPGLPVAGDTLPFAVPRSYPSHHARDGGSRASTGHADRAAERRAGDAAGRQPLEENAHGGPSRTPDRSAPIAVSRPRRARAVRGVRSTSRGGEFSPQRQRRTRPPPLATSGWRWWSAPVASMGPPPRRVVADDFDRGRQPQRRRIGRRARG